MFKANEQPPSQYKNDKIMQRHKQDDVEHTKVIKNQY